MKAPVHLSICFTDGSFCQIEIANAIELKVRPEAKQSLEFREIKSSNKWVMAYTSPLFEGKKIEKIVLQ